MVVEFSHEWAQKNDNFKHIKLIACDMDGTLVNNEHRVPEKTVTAIETLRNDFQIDFIIATGRNRFSAQGVVGEVYDLSKRPGVYLNGSVAYGHSGELLVEHYTDPEMVKEVMMFIQTVKDKASINIASFDKFYAPDLCEPYVDFLHREYLDPYPTKLEKGYDTEADDLPHCHLLHILASREFMDELLPKVKEILSKYDVVLSRNLLTDTAITNPLATKGHALHSLCEKFSIELAKNVICFGDSGNDITMLQRAAVGIAMDNALDDVKKQACSFSNSNCHDMNGVCQVLESLITIKREA